MAVDFYGPINQKKIIRTVFANTFIDPSLYAGAIVRVNLANGNNGNYKLNEIVYQGSTYRSANAAGIVVKWDANNSYLKLGSVQGTFKTNQNIISTTTNAEYQLVSFDVSPLKVVSIKTTPDPSDAEPGDPFGFNQVITEYPNG